MTRQVFNQTKNSATEEIFIPQAAARNLDADSWTKYHLGALVGLPGGILVLLGAIFLNVFDLAAGAKPHGIWLFVAAYPLFALGAHCLDKIGEMKKAAKAKKQQSNLERLNPDNIFKR
ncbi:MAG TPA: hypothetical protein VGC97_21995 [Pyrinomonadaceae bacterium]|jgi:hypothetical protein